LLLGDPVLDVDCIVLGQRTIHTFDMVVLASFLGVR